MKLNRVLAVMGFAAVAGGFVLVEACSSDVKTGEEAAAELGGPPAKPDAPATKSTTEKNFAVKTVLLGDKPEEEWKRLGYNLDGKVSKRTSTDGCKPVAGASSDVRQDGENGIDNAFGASILPLIKTARQDAADVMNQTIADGKFTLMLLIKGLSEDADQTATGLSGSILAGSAFNGKPTFTKADNWPVRPETLTDKKDPTSSSIRFDDAYVVKGQFVARTNLTINLVFGGTALELDLKKATLTFNYAGGKADKGIIGGVVGTQELMDQLNKIRGSISPSLCEGELIDGITRQIKEASDIMSDGSAGSPSQECNGISLGLGFSAVEIGAPKDVGPAAVASDSCAAGAKDGG